LLGNTKPTIKWVSGSLAPAVNSPGDDALIIYLHAAPIYVFMTMCFSRKDTLPFPVQYYFKFHNQFCQSGL